MQAGSGTVPGPGVLHPCADDPMLLLLLAGPPGGRRPCRVEQRQCGLELSSLVMAPGGVLALLEVTVSTVKAGDITAAALSLASLLVKVPVEIVSAEEYVRVVPWVLSRPFPLA